ncbi:MAG: FMN reductase [Propionibacteriales bacterium]|nr:FMN reductase [Propionibacteriales bacterium]
MTSRSLAVVSGGVSQPSSTRLLGDRLAGATVRALNSRGVDADVHVVELREHGHNLVNNMLTGFPGPALREAVGHVVDADALIAVTPVFTASYSGLFKSFFDVLDADSLSGKPVLVAATGGTERHSLILEHAMRPLFAYLKCVVVPTAVFAASSDWASAEGDGSVLGSRVDRAGRELAQLAAAVGPVGPPDPFDDPTPFAQLLVDG